jgi:hypothetical protein
MLLLATTFLSFVMLLPLEKEHLTHDRMGSSLRHFSEHMTPVKYSDKVYLGELRLKVETCKRLF